MQQRNFVLFMVISLAIMFGWMWLQNQIWPPSDQPPEQKLTETQKEAASVTNVFATAANPMVGVWQSPTIATSLKIAENYAALPEVKPEIRVAHFNELTSQQQLQISSAASVLPSVPAFVPQLLRLKDLVQDAPKPKKIEFFTLGDTDYYLNVVVTNQGAGVRRVTLSDFKAADEYGLPTGKVLNLVQDDPFRPSFLMYYYPKATASHPVPNLGEVVWEQQSPIKAGDHQEITFHTTLSHPFSHLTIYKRYRLEKNSYHIGLEITIEDTRKAAKDDAAVPAFRYQLAGAHGLPVEGIWYTDVTRASMIGWLDSAGTFTRDRQDAPTISVRKGGNAVPEALDGANFCYAGVVTQYFASLIVPANDQSADGPEKKEMLAWARPTLETESVKGVIVDIKPFHIVLQSGKNQAEFFPLKYVAENAELRHLKKGDKVVVYYYQYRGTNIATFVQRGTVPQPRLNDITVRVNSMPIKMKPGGKTVHRYMLYHGPVKLQSLGRMGSNSVSPELEDKYEAHHLRTLTDYGSIFILSDLIIFFTKIMQWMLHMLRFVGPGLSIILLTVIVRGALFPLSKKQAMMSIKMQELAPEMKKIQEKYKSDPKAKSEATMKLYRETGVNPLGMCLPMLMQLPIFIGLYWGLRESVHFRLSSFLWMRNLAAPDMMIWWGESIPLISNPDNMNGWFYLGPYFNLMPILAISMMLIHQKLFTPPPTDDQQKASQRMMRIMMMVFGLLFYKLAAGLCIYFTASSLWGFAERKLLPKKKDPGDGSNSVARTKPTTPKGGGKKKGKQRGGKGPESGLNKVKNWWSDLVKKASKD